MKPNRYPVKQVKMCDPAIARNLQGHTSAALIAACLLLLVILAGAITPAEAQRGRRQEVVRGSDYYQKRDYVLDQRYNHNRRYPRPGLWIDRLPPGSRVSPYRRQRYYYNDGVWFRPSRRGFSVVRPPIGLTIPILPPFYTTLWVSGTPYYYADGIYYVWQPESRVYVVAEPPPETEVVEQDAIPDRIFIYPKAGQSETQQENDRYECHSWAVSQTGFDPTQPSGNVPETQYAEKRLEYQRAMKACLEARNYSVQ